MRQRIKLRARRAKQIIKALPIVMVVSSCMLMATVLGDYTEHQPLDRL